MDRAIIVPILIIFIFIFLNINAFLILNYYDIIHLIPKQNSYMGRWHFDNCKFAPK